MGVIGCPITWRLRGIRKRVEPMLTTGGEGVLLDGDLGGEKKGWAQD